MPDLHHYNGRGGRIFPLWADRAGKTPNVQPDLLELLAEAYGAPVAAEDVVAYLAAVLAHPAFTKRFKADLVQPGLRVPLTAETALFAEAAALGREVVWLHTFGERFADAAAGRPKGAPKLPEGSRPTVTAAGAIPSAPEPLPDTMRFDPATRQLHIGKGFVSDVSPAMWAYEVSGKNVLRQWFSYRRLDREKPPMGDRRPPSKLSFIQPEGWLPEYTTDLLELLNVLGRLAALEPGQADLLERILAAKLLDKGMLAEAAAAQQSD